MAVLKILSPVYTQICFEDPSEFRAISSYLSFKKEVWRWKWIKGYRKKCREEYSVSMIKKVEKNLVVLSGLVPTIKEFSAQKNIPLKISGISNHTQIIKGQAYLPKITFRKDQKDLLQKLFQKGRGVLKAPTGSGKTIILMGIISALKETNVLFLCNNLTILKQTQTELEKHGFNEVGIIYGGVKRYGRIQLASIQSYSKLINYHGTQSTKYGAVLVDECHHCSTTNGLYGKVLQKIDAPVRVGVTATLPYTQEAKLALVGLIGPLVGETTIHQAQNAGILAKLKLHIVKIPKNKHLVLHDYVEIYKAGIIENTYRNTKIINIAKTLTEKNLSVLINVRRLSHGKILREIAANKGLRCIFIDASASPEEREKIRLDLHSKKILCVISSPIFKEAVNIPSLNCCINAAGGKSEIETLQVLGRGARSTNKKKEVLLVEFADPYRYLSAHSKRRIETYKKEGWIESKKNLAG
jgi:superfamily II DNA or RNA helicase